MQFATPQQWLDHASIFCSLKLFPRHRMDHWVGIVFKFVDNWDDCVFDERLGCEDWLVGSFLTDGENIYWLL
jgi:hypothetical protein